MFFLIVYVILYFLQSTFIKIDNLKKLNLINYKIIKYNDEKSLINDFLPIAQLAGWYSPQRSIPNGI